MTDKVVGLDGRQVDADSKPEGALLDLARNFLAQVVSGEVKSAVLITVGDKTDDMVDTEYLWYGRQTTLIGMLDRCKHKVNLSLDGTLDTGEDD